MTKVRKYTEAIMVRLDKITHMNLEKKAYKLEMNEAVYARKAIEICLKRNLINGNSKR